MAGRIIDPVRSGRRVARAERPERAEGENDRESVEVFEGTHLAIGVIEIRPGERAVLGADLTGREEVWYAVSGQGVYRPSRQGALTTGLTDGTATRSEDARGADPGEEILPQGSLAVTRAGEGATVRCDGDRPLVLLAIRSPLPARVPVVETQPGGRGRTPGRKVEAGPRELAGALQGSRENEAKPVPDAEGGN